MLVNTSSRTISHSFTNRNNGLLLLGECRERRVMICRPLRVLTLSCVLLRSAALYSLTHGRASFIARIGTDSRRDTTDS